MFVHGYHPAVEDGEFYVPGIIKDLHPAIYPFNGQFFESHAQMTLFDDVVSASVRLTHIPLRYALFLWHFLCIFLFLVGCWRVSEICFRDERAAWGSIALIAPLLTLGVAGTALYIMDQYLNPRDISSAAIMLLLAEGMQRKFVRALVGMLVIVAIHPIMALFGIALLGLLYLEERRAVDRAVDAELASVAAMLLLPLAVLFLPASPVYRQLLQSNYSYFLITRWQWYGWAGIIGPPLLFLWLARYGRENNLPKIQVLARVLIVFEAFFFVAAMLVCIPRLATFALLQPMRCLHLVFIMLFILLGGVLAQSLLKSHLWRWIALVAPLCVIMFIAQRQLFASTEHLELPGGAPRNPWAQAFLWIRNNTPPDAIFALDPNYMNLPGEDEHGFRAISRRTALAGNHDSGAVIMFPALAQDWYKQMQAQQGWKNFQAQDFRRLRQDWGVTWVVLERPAAPGLACPYENDAVMVCRVD